MEERKLMVIIIIMTYVILSQWVIIGRHKQKINDTKDTDENPNNEEVEKKESEENPSKDELKND